MEKFKISEISNSDANMALYAAQKSIIRKTFGNSSLNYGKIVVFSDSDLDG